MNYENLKKLSSAEFKRFTGVYPETFQEMVKVVKEQKAKHKKTGRNNTLSIENQILLTLSYLREYRTYFNLGQEVNLHESNVCRTIHNIEKILVKSGCFSLPGKKALNPQALSETSPLTIVIDVTETEIERPKKKQKKLQW